MSTKTAILLFGKYPREGFVKTRLAKTIGDTKATDFYRTCLLGIFEEALKLPADYELFFYYAEEADAAAVRAMTPKRIITRPQIDDGLPRRITEAFAEVFELGYEKVVIYSTDVPSLDARVFTRASDSLKETNVVIGSDSDGGYYCLGMDAYYPELLDVEYGGDVGMFALTLQKAKQLDLTTTALQELNDVDTVEDLKNFKQNNLVTWQDKFAYLDPV